MNERLGYLLKKYLDKTINPFEKEEFFEYVRDPASSEFLKKAIENALASESPVSLPEKDALYHAILERNEIKPARRVSARTFIGWGAVAASLLLFVFLWSPDFIQTKTGLFASQQVDSSYTFRKSDDLRLPDGSVVRLKEESELEIFFKNGQFTREVCLTGEAFFDIQRDPQKQFVVRTGDIKTTVLGTAFNIRTTGPETEVIVTRGVVVVSEKNKTYGKLTAREQMNIKKQVATLQILSADDISAIAPDLLLLTFEEATLAEVLQRVGEKFDTKITLENQALAQCRVSASFTNGESLEDILELICLMRHATYTTSGGHTKILGGKPCNQTP